MTRLIIFLVCILFGMSGKCFDVTSDFPNLFGVKSFWGIMKTKTFFDSKLQIDLANAIAKGDTNKIQALIADGADVNYLGSHGMKPLFWAMVKQNIKAFGFLLNKGADPNAVIIAEQQSVDSALTLAAGMDDSEYVRELLAHGAKPNFPVGSRRQTAIFSAVLFCKSNNISILLKNGADIDWKDADGYTPFHYAINTTSLEMALLLYRAGANPLIMAKWNNSPIDSLKEFKDRGIRSRADKSAYKELVGELTKRGLLDKAP